MMRKLHSIIGLAAALLLVFMALTGAVLAVNPALERASVAAGAGQGDVAGFARAVVDHYPGVERIVRRPSGQMIVYYFKDDVPGADIVDATGQSQGPYVQSEFTRWMTNLHRSFLLGDTGRAAAGLSALAMMVLAVSGAVLMVKRMGGVARLLGPIRGSFNQRLHGEAGRIAVVFLLMTALTGCTMSLTTFGFVSDGMDAEPAAPKTVNGGQPMDVGAMLALQGVKLADLRELAFPYADDLTDVYTLTTATGTTLIDQATGEPLSTLAHSPARRLYETVYMLHTGEGLWWLGLLLCAAALSVPALAMSGTVIWWTRRQSMPKIAQNVRGAVADTIILVGSEGNATWGFAKTLHASLTAKGHHVHTGPMNALAAAYPAAQRMFVLTSTYGDGAAPASARQFLGKLSDLPDAAALPVAVLGFGDAQFPAFCQFAKDVEAEFSRRNWPQFVPLELIDRQSVQAFARWGQAVGKAMGHDLVLNHVVSAPVTHALALESREDYGVELQSPAAILRFSLVERGKPGLWQRLTGRGTLRFEAGDLVGIVPPGSSVPRYYSLASASSDGVLEICVRKQPGGLCSEFLHGLLKGDRIDAFIQANPDFRPVRNTEPVILIGAGTGIGPLAGFIRHNRSHQPMHLYFGARDPQSDFLYEEQLKGWLAEKRLTRLTMAFSRIGKRAYVQNQIVAGAYTIRALVAKGAQVMVCGGRDMAQGVKLALADVLAPLGMDVAMLKLSGRYREDVY